ncbi:MAG TPA: BamA/TamA family outer membrane protein, partial [Candidatus Limnocylindria bacterium]|nr:BamA/TamA family outer membrane protein [Candidatus Limnocylindria bacterium]
KTRQRSLWPWRDRPALRLDFLRSDTLAIAALYRHHGYIDARAGVEVMPSRDAGQVIVTFRVHEGERARIAAIELAGVASYDEADLRRRLWARPGRPFNPAYLQLDTLRISELYQDRGYRPHVAASYRRDSLQITVRYQVNEGPLYRIGEIYIASREASVGVNERLIRRELVLRKGDVYRRSRMERSIERLYESGLFSQVQVTPLPDSNNTLIEFYVGVRERKPRWLDAGLGSGTTERFRFTGEWGHRNILGHGLQGALNSKLTFYGTGDFQLWRTEASLLEPWLLNSRTRGQVTPFYEQSNDRADKRWVVRQEASGVNFQLRRELGRFSRILLNQSNVFAKQDLEIEDRFVPDSTRDSVEATVVSFYSTHRLGLGLERDYRDNPLDPGRGSVQSLSGEIAGGPFKGKSSFSKVQLVSSWYTPIGTGWVLATRIRGGTIRPFGDPSRFSPEVSVDPDVARLPVQDRFRTGGVNSIRGFDENAIPPSGGLAIVQANLELRIPLAGPLGVEFYVDAGNVWTRPSYIRWHQFVPAIGREPLDPGDVRYVAGFGPRVKLPIGPLRVDFTWALRPAEVVEGDGRKRSIGPRYGRPAIQFAVGPSF